MFRLLSTIYVFIVLIGVLSAVSYAAETAAAPNDQSLPGFHGRMVDFWQRL
jgi:hypothetical protein